MPPSPAFVTRRSMAAVALIWIVAAAASVALVVRFQDLPAKGSAHPLNASGQSLLAPTSANGIPPDPGRGPLPLCWVDAKYQAPAGEPCPAVPAGEARP